MQDGIKSLRKSADEIPAFCLFCCPDDFFIRGIRFSEADIFTDSTGFDPGILKHHTEALSERMSGKLIDRFTVDTDLSGIHVIEAHQEVDKCCFSASGRTYDRNTHTRFNLKVKVFNQRFTLVIAEIYVVDIHISIHLLKYFRRIVYFFRFF